METPTTRKYIVTGAAGSVGREMIEGWARAVHADKKYGVDTMHLPTHVVGIDLCQRPDWFPPQWTWVQDDLSLKFPGATIESLEDATTVFHLAAIKAQGSTMAPDRVVDVNTSATIRLATWLARKAKAPVNFVFASSIKASDPRSLMAMTKLAAEQGLNDLLRHTCPGREHLRIACVRFAAVWGSKGSIFELLVQRLKQNMPIFCSQWKAERYVQTTYTAAEMMYDANTYLLDSEPGMFFTMFRDYPVFKLRSVFEAAFTFAEKPLEDLDKIEEKGLPAWESVDESIISEKTANIFEPHGPLHTKHYRLMSDTPDKLRWATEKLEPLEKWRSSSACPHVLLESDLLGLDLPCDFPYQRPD